MQRIVWLLIFFLFGTSVFCQVTEVTKLTEEELKAKGWKLEDPQIVVSDGDLQIGPFDVRDFYTRERFIDKDGLQISIYKADSTTLLSNYIRYSIANINGVRKIYDSYVNIPLLRRIVIKVEKEGYDPVVMAVDLPDEKDLKREKDGKYHWNKLDRILINRSIVTKQLGEASVTASRLQMVVRGDTLEYNVANLQLTAGSMLDNLIRNLPGAQLDKNGRISVNGEFVSKLLVNGREFFNGDVMVALRNLPYYTVGKIKVYHNIGSGFVSKADSLRRLRSASLTMDVRLKKMYRKVWLANMEIGGGSRTHQDWSNVYFGRFFVMRFTDHSSIGIYGIANNIGKNYSATHNGNWREMVAYGLGGEPITQSGGIDFSVDGKKTEVKFHTDLQVKNEKNLMENCISEQNFLSGGDIFDRYRLMKRSRTFQADWTARLEKNFKHFNFSIDPKISYSRNREYEEAQSASFNGDPMDRTRCASLDSIFDASRSDRLMDLLIKRSRIMAREKRSWFRTEVQTSMSFKLPFLKYYIPLIASVDYTRTEKEYIRFSNVWSKVNSYNENSFQATPWHKLNVKGGSRVSLFDYSKGDIYVSGSLSYDISHSYDDAERRLYKDDGEWPEYVPNMQTGYAWEYNLRNSYQTDKWQTHHRLEWITNVTLPGIRKGRTVEIGFNLPFQVANHRVMDNRNNHEQQLRKKYYYFTPNVQISALNNALIARYDLSTELPELNELLDIYDDASSLYQTLGNPNLKSSQTHRFELRWQRRKRAMAQWMGFAVRHEIQNRQHTQAMTYNRETGVTTSRPVNINGNWWTNAEASYGRALDKQKHFNLSSKLYYTFANSVAYANDREMSDLLRQTVHNNRIGFNASISYSKNERRASFESKVNWTGLHSAATNFQNMSYVDMTYSLSFTTPLVWRIAFDTDVNLTMRRGFREPSMNTTDWVWNAALSTSLGRTGQWVLRAVAFDILHQLSNVTTTVNAQGHREWWMNGGQSYASLHLVYHFKVKPTKKGIE